MISISNNILIEARKKKESLIWRSLILCWGLLIFLSQSLLSQIIYNNGAVISLTSGVVVVSKDAINFTGGNILNNGSINLSGNYTNVATTLGDGFYRLGGNWTNTGTFTPGLSTVIFDGSVNQLITRPGGELFYNLSISNTGAALNNIVGISDNVTVSGTFSMSAGNVNTAAYILYLSNQAAASLNYTSASGSRVLGKFERGINLTGGNYLFPLGTTNYYNPANLKTNNVVSAGSVLSQFITSPAPGNTGLPVPDPPVEIAETFPDGFWSFTAKNAFSSNNFNINLRATGFVDTVWSTTRVVKRIAGGAWTVDGTHQVADTVNNIVYRNNLTGGISNSGTEFALGRAHPLITLHPVDLIQCEKTTAIFTVAATGAALLTYRWYKDGVIITSGPHNNYTARKSTLTILNISLADTGYYYCIVSDRYRISTTSKSAHLKVMKIPKATASIHVQPDKCSDIPFTGIVLGQSYGDAGTTFGWTRNVTPDIQTTIPANNSGIVIGDSITGSFKNITDNPVTMTFIITPVGPGPTTCIGDTIQSKVTINPIPRALPLNNLPAICYGNSTDIVLKTPTHLTRGVINYDYTITRSGATVTGNMSPASNLTENYHIRYPYLNSSDTIQSVFYHITPKPTALGCTADIVPYTSEVKVHPYPLDTILIYKPLTCEGGSDASIRVVTNKGAGPYYLVWYGPYSKPFKGYGLVDTTGLRGGRYDIIVTDNLGCTNFNDEYVTVHGAILDSRIEVIPKSTGYGTSCWYGNDGALWIRENSYSSGTKPFSYWIIHNSIDTLFTGTLPDKDTIRYFSNLEQGNYLLYVKDKNGCSDFTDKDVIPPDTIKMIFTKKVYKGGYNITCKGYNDGFIKASVMGGNGPYTYKWTTVNGVITGPDNLDSLSNVTAGTYRLTMTDQMSCTATDSVTVYEPSGMMLASSSVSLARDGYFNISCNGGNDGFINITVIGGSGNYLYSWTDSASFTATTQNISGLTAGNYYCNVTDQTGCILLPMPSFGLIEPTHLNITMVPSTAPNGPYNINCHGGTGSVTVTVTGGIAGTYHYTWSTNNGSGIVQGAKDQALLTAGTYHLVVRDTNGCEETKDITLAQPDPLTTSLQPTGITCAAPLFDNGSITLVVSGGEAPYSYLWSNGKVTQNISGLTQGLYSVTVTDANGCTKIDSARINLPSPVLYTKKVFSINGFNVSCNGSDDGAIKIKPTSGSAPFTFNWTGPNSFTATTDSISGLKAGTYNLTITDSKYCTATEDINLSEPGVLGMNISVSVSTVGGYNINCAGQKTGSIDIVPVNAVGTVSYLWSDGITTQNRSNIPAGDYGVIIIDANGCKVDSSITLTQPDSIKLKLSVTEPWCPDKPDGALTITATGGVIGTDYAYKWSDNSTGNNIFNLLPGFYWVKVTDMNGCQVKDSINLEPQKETCLIIPNIISPNGDLINDVWNIGMIDLYPQVEIIIFNRWGQTLWRSEKGYPHPWDGTSNGTALPIDSYHYIIDLHNGRKPIIGNVTVVK